MENIIYVIYVKLFYLIYVSNKQNLTMQSTNFTRTYLINEENKSESNIGNLFGDHTNHNAMH